MISDFNFNNLIEETTPSIKFKEEIEEGNIEYKLRLDYKNESSLKKMKNQMNWRFEEGKELTGKRECHYILGIYDNGKLGKLNEEQINKTFEVFKNVVETCEATITFCEKKLIDDSWIIFVSLLQILEKKITEINIGFVGPAQSGKTTTISNIVYGQLDDGNGISRQHIFRHEHEKISGYTSCIKKEIVGVKNNTIINYNTGINVSWEHIANMSDRILCLIDLPGAPQYMKTILFGLSAYNMDALVIFNDSSISKDENNINKLYIEYARTLNIPYIIVEIYDMISPATLTPNSDKSDKSNKSNNKFNSLFMDTFVDEIFFPSTNNVELTDANNNHINAITNTKVNGIKSIISFLTKVKKQNNYVAGINDNLFVITDVVSIPDTGIVYSGEMWYGKLSINDNIFLTNGNLTFNLKIQSIHKKQTFTDTLYTNEMGAILLSGTNMDIQKNSKQMIITTQQLQSYAQIIFETNSSYKIIQNMELIVYVNNNTVKGIIKEIDSSSNNKKYIMTLRKNIIIVPRIKNLAFAKIDNKIFIINILV
jgi:GTPase